MSLTQFDLANHELQTNTEPHKTCRQELKVPSCDHVVLEAKINPPGTRGPPERRESEARQCPPEKGAPQELGETQSPLSPQPRLTAALTPPFRAAVQGHPRHHPGVRTTRARRGVRCLPGPGTAVDLCPRAAGLALHVFHVRFGNWELEGPSPAARPETRPTRVWEGVKSLLRALVHNLASMRAWVSLPWGAGCAPG